MPLVRGSSKKAIRANTAIEIAAGKPPAQAYAIANSEARSARKKKRKSKIATAAGG